jgi:hypothetical protein
MGVIPDKFDPGCLKPICNDCGVALCWDVSIYEYEEAEKFWDNWRCKDCNPNYRGALKRFKSNTLQ